MVAEGRGGGRGDGGSGPWPTVYFLSDYGTVDEFVGVVHAVLHAVAPTLTVIDLSHQVPAFDIAAGAAMLVRAGPYLGAGVVLAVVDPGVGTDRRGVALEVPAGGPQWLVGPDNGLLLSLADSLGGVRAAFALDPVRAGSERHGRTFDGRDAFAPAAAHLALGGHASEIGLRVETATLRPAPDGGRPDRADPGGEGTGLSTTVTWIDRFGNVQLTARPDALSAIGVPGGGTARLTFAPGDGGGGETEGRTVVARRVRAFGQLARGEFGLLDDANGLVSVVLDRASASRALGVTGTGVAVRVRADAGGARPDTRPPGV